MNVYTQLTDIVRHFVERLRQLDSAYFVLRTMCELDLTDSISEDRACDLGTHLWRIFAKMHHATLPPMIQAIVSCDQDES